MNKFKEKLELLFEVARIAFCIPSMAFILLFAVIWAVGGMEDQIAQRLGIVALCTTVPAVVLNLIWLFTGNKEDNNESTERKNKDFHPYRKAKKHPRERRGSGCDGIQ
jgi:hypothetical protein